MHKKELPQAIEIEMAILGAMLLDPSCIPVVVEILTVEDFYHPSHRVIYNAILEMFDKGEEITLLNLRANLESKGLLEKAGGLSYLLEISDFVSTSAGVRSHAKIIRDKRVLREIIELSKTLENDALNHTIDAADVLKKAESGLFKIASNAFVADSEVKFENALKRILEKYEILVREKREVNGLLTGFRDLDLILGGFQNSDLIIIAGRPGMGKTAFALNIARNIAGGGNAVAFFSLEMSLEQIMLRFIAMEANIDLHALRTARISTQEWEKIVKVAGEKIYNLPIFIDDSPALSILELRAKSKRLKEKHDIKLLIVDYLQLMHPPEAETREREISIISRSLKNLAKELDIPVIALSQLRRAVEERADKKPHLSDLRESGSLEQDADVVIFIYRPEYYGITIYDDGTSTEGTAVITVAKQRNGPTGDIRVAFLKHCAKFANLETIRKEEIF